MKTPNWLHCLRSLTLPDRQVKTASQRRTRLGVHLLEDRSVPSWLAQIGGPGEERQLADRGMSQDVAGNVYVGGNFEQYADFDSTTGPGARLTSAGMADAYVARYSAAGVLAWARRFGGTKSESVASVVADPTGQYVYISGRFSGAADFTGDEVADATARSTSPIDDVFLVKLDAATGATMWFRVFGSTGVDYAQSVALSGTSVWLVGVFGGTLDFDPGPGTRTLTPNGKGKHRPTDAFVLRLDADGNHLASWQIGGSSSDSATSVVTDGDTVYVSGSFNGTVDFDPGPGVASKTSTTSGGTFIARYAATSSTPTLNWVQAIAFTPHETLAADATSLYMLGNFDSTFDVDPGNGTWPLTTDPYSDVFAARYTKSSGSLVWAQQFGSPGSTQRGTGRMLIDEASGTAYLGMYSDVDAGPGGAYPAGGYLIKVDVSNGGQLATWQVSGSGSAGGIRPIGLVGSTVYAAGWFTDTATFPTGDTRTSRGPAGTSDAYVMAFEEAPPIIPQGAMTPAGDSPTVASPTMAFDIDPDPLGMPVPATKDTITLVKPRRY
jgi:hypothetical protein